MTGRLQEEKGGGGEKNPPTTTVRAFEIFIPSSYLRFLYGCRTACYNSGSLQKHIHVQAGFF